MTNFTTPALTPSVPTSVPSVRELLPTEIEAVAGGGGTPFPNGPPPLPKKPPST
jgi:hypothetical protein